MSFALKLALGLLLATAPVAGSAQAVTDIRIGQTVAKKVGAKVEIYRLVGGPGTTIQATLTTPGKAALILYTPAGEEMLTVEGTGSVTLDAILPLWDVFFIGVVRKKAAQPHSLKLAGVDPDRHLAAFADDTGYKSDHPQGAVTTCWIEPGIKLRRTYPDRVEEISIGRGGKEFGSWKLKNGKTGAAERTVRFEGQTMVIRTASGKEHRRELDPTRGTYPGATYHSYLCEPGP